MSQDNHYFRGLDVRLFYKTRKRRGESGAEKDRIERNWESKGPSVLQASLGIKEASLRKGGMS